MCKQKAISPCCLSKLEMEDAHWLEQAKEGGHPAIGVQPRLRLVEEAPLVEQADAGAGNELGMEARRHARRERDARAMASFVLARLKVEWSLTPDQVALTGSAGLFGTLASLGSLPCTG